MKFLNNLWQNYKSISHKIGVFQSKVILTVFYFLLSPFGLFFSFFKDDLKMKKIQSSTWIDKKNQSENIKDLSSQ